MRTTKTVKYISFISLIWSFSCGQDPGSNSRGGEETEVDTSSMTETEGPENLELLLPDLILGYDRMVKEYYNNLDEINIDPYLSEDIEMGGWSSLVVKQDSSRQIYSFIDNELKKMYPPDSEGYPSKFEEIFNPSRFKQLLKDTFHFKNKIIFVKKAKSVLDKEEWKEVKKKQYFGKAIYNDNNTVTADDDELFIAVHVRDEVDKRQVLIFIIYHELVHFYLEHAKPGGKYECALSSENAADCHASSSLFKKDGGIVIGATSYAFYLADQLRDYCHDSFSKRSDYIVECTESEYY